MIENITIGEIVKIIGVISVIVGAFVKIHKIVVKAEEDRKQLLLSINGINSRIDNVEIENDKNFLVWFLSDVEQGKEMDEVEYERFYETYERYINRGKNGYIKHKVQTLQKNGKLK